MNPASRFVLALALVGCSNVTSPAIEAAVHPLPLAEDAGELVEADPDSGAAVSPDAGTAPAEDAGSTTPERDAGELADSSPPAPGVDAAVASCTLAGAGQDVCDSYGFAHYVMYWCASSCGEGQTQVETSTFNDGGAALACCAAP